MYNFSSYFAIIFLLFMAWTSYKKRYISLNAIYILNFSCSYTCDVMKRRVLFGSRMKGYQRVFDRQLTRRATTTSLATVETS